MVYESATNKPADRRRERRRRAILDEALALVHAGGLGALTIHALAKALDYTPGALYRYFDGREDLLLALQIEVAEEWGAALARARARCAGRLSDPAAQALLLPMTTAALLRDLAHVEPARFALVTEVLGASRHVIEVERARHLVAPLLVVLAQVAGDLRAAEGVALDPGVAEQRAIVLLGAVQGLLQLRKLERLGPAQLAVGPLVPELVRGLLAGWGAPHRPLELAAIALDALVADAPLVSGGPS